MSKEFSIQDPQVTTRAEQSGHETGEIPGTDDALAIVAKGGVATLNTAPLRPIETFRYPIPFEDDPTPDQKGTPRTKKWIAVLAGAAALLTGVWVTTPGEQDDTKTYANHKVERATEIEICDGANVRQNPRVEGAGSPEGLVDQVDLGDGKDRCIKIPIDTAYKKPDSLNGDWYGLPEEDLAVAMPTLHLNKKSKTNIVWINAQKAHLLTTPDERLSEQTNQYTQDNHTPTEYSKNTEEIAK